MLSALHTPYCKFVYRWPDDGQLTETCQDKNKIKYIVVFD